MKPIKTRIRKWVKALRSGEFTQHLAELRGQGKERCCLGVACDVFRRETGRGRWYNGEFQVDGSSDAGVMPAPVRDWFGLSTYNPLLQPHMTASMANDAGRSFSYIADKIEEKFVREGK